MLNEHVLETLANVTILFLIKLRHATTRKRGCGTILFGVNDSIPVCLDPLFPPLKAQYNHTVLFSTTVLAQQNWKITSPRGTKLLTTQALNVLVFPKNSSELITVMLWPL